MTFRESWSILPTLNRAELIAGLLAVAGIIYFGLPSPETRPKSYELALALVWGLGTLSSTSIYMNWSSAHWSRKIMAVVAPLAAVLYMAMYLG